METPDQFIPACEALGWPTWETPHGESAVLEHEDGMNSWNILYQETVDGEEYKDRVYADSHVALCILEKWFRKKLDARGVRIHRGDDYWASWPEQHGSDLVLTAGGWVEQDPVEWCEVATFPAEAEAMVAALKAICDGMDSD